MNKIMRISVSVLLLATVMAATFCVINNVPTVRAAQSGNDNTFYVGVTYCGNNPAEAAQLIDKVKNYTNLFIVQSDSLQNNLTALEQVCDYAVKSGLNVIAYFGSYESQRSATASFIDVAQARWGSQFLGIYYGDEPGGKTLDSFASLNNVPNMGNVSKSQYGISISQNNISINSGETFDFSGQISLSYQDIANNNGLFTNYYPNGTITNATKDGELTYFPNGTVTLYHAQAWISFPNGTNIFQKDWNTTTVVTDRGNISQFEPYQKLWDSRPLQTSKDAPAIAAAYVNNQREMLSWISNQSNVNLFTSDYGLQWYDYQAGYNVVLTEFGSNQSVTQEIALDRGAANLIGKDWGAMITWKYTQAPYLAGGDEIYQQMCQAYEGGAKYIAIFNYAPDMQGPYGTLQQQHFDALQRFWTSEVNNASVTRGQVKADAAFVLLNDYGSGLRSQKDTVWGFWSPTQHEQQIWLQLQNAVKTYGEKLDIVYSDPTHTATGQYAKLIYPSFTNWLLIALLVAAVVAVVAVLVVVRRKRRKSVAHLIHLDETTSHRAAEL